MRKALGSLSSSPDHVLAYAWHMQGVPHHKIEVTARMAAYDPEIVSHALQALKQRPDIRPAKPDGFEQRLAALAVLFDLRLPHLAPLTEVVLRKATSVFYPGTRRNVAIRGVNRMSPAFILYSLGIPADKIIGAGRYSASDADVVRNDMRILWDASAHQLLPRGDWKKTAQALSIYLAEQERKEYTELRRMADWLYSDRSKTEELEATGILSA